MEPGVVMSMDYGYGNWYGYMSTSMSMSISMGMGMNKGGLRYWISDENGVHTIISA